MYLERCVPILDTVWSKGYECNSNDGGVTKELVFEGTLSYPLVVVDPYRGPNGPFSTENKRIIK